MKKEILSTSHDSIVGVDYSIIKVNSAELSQYLKDDLNSRSIDYNKFNADRLRYNNEPVEINLPLETYEYQNFFLLETESGEFILLDGFRRLLWNSPVDHNILVRVYRQRDLDTKKLLHLLVSLNHTKFFGGIGSFYDRGFAMGMFLLFNVDITKIYDSFNGYLVVKEAKYNYSISRHYSDVAAITTLEKVNNINFIHDMKFLQELSEFDVIQMDTVFGGFIFDVRKSNPDIIFNAKDFVDKIQKNEVLMKQIESFKKAQDSRRNDIGNKMFETLSNILLGKENEKSFIERKDDVKNIVAKLKKDASWFCYTSNKKIGDHIIARSIESFYNTEKRFPKVKIVVFPSENKGELFADGIHDDFEMVGVKKGTHLINVWYYPIIKRGEFTVSSGGGKNHRTDLSIIDNGWTSKIRIQHEVVVFIENIFN
jgi:hypothetical protein